MEIHDFRRADEPLRNPTWFSPDEAKRRLAKGREVKYGREMEAVIDRALERIQFHRAPGLGYANGRNGHAVVQP
jgi:hypothetical protein